MKNNPDQITKEITLAKVTWDYLERQRAALHKSFKNPTLSDVIQVMITALDDRTNAQMDDLAEKIEDLVGPEQWKKLNVEATKKGITPHELFLKFMDSQGEEKPDKPDRNN